jgi:chaperonin cofactor prefoldin
MDDDLQQLTEKLRRSREKIEKALSDTLTDRSEDLVKRITELRERIEHRLEERAGAGK